MHNVLELLGAGLVIYLVVRLLDHLFGGSKEKLRESYQEGFIEGKRHCDVCSQRKKQVESESFWKEWRQKMGWPEAATTTKEQ